MVELSLLHSQVVVCCIHFQGKAQYDWKKKELEEWNSPIKALFVWWGNFFFQSSYEATTSPAESLDFFSVALKLFCLTRASTNLFQNAIQLVTVSIAHCCRPNPTPATCPPPLHLILQVIQSSQLSLHCGDFSASQCKSSISSLNSSNKTRFYMLKKW